MENTIKSKRNQNKNIYQHGTYNLETVSEETFEMRITGEPKEPNLESFSLTWSANHLSIYNSSRPYRRVILQPVHLSGIRQSLCSHGTMGYSSSKVCLGMRQFFIVEIHNFPFLDTKSAMFHKSYQKKIWSLETPGFVKKLPSPYQEKISSLVVIASEKRDSLGWWFYGQRLSFGFFTGIS